MSVRAAKTQISLGIRPVWSESSLSPWRKLGSLATHLMHSEDSDQTGRMPRLIWVFAGHTVTLLVLSCRGSNELAGELHEIFCADQRFTANLMVFKIFVWFSYWKTCKWLTMAIWVVKFLSLSLVHKYVGSRLPHTVGFKGCCGKTNVTHIGRMWRFIGFLL